MTIRRCCGTSLILKLVLILFIITTIHIDVVNGSTVAHGDIHQFDTASSLSLSSSQEQLDIPIQEITTDPSQTKKNEVNRQTSDTVVRRKQQQQRLRRHHYHHHQQQERNLPGNDYNMDNIDINSAEAGFVIGILFIIFISLFICCCCCNLLFGGRRRYNNNGGGGSSCLWDLVAIVCLWELCCDNDGMMGDGFMRF